MDIGLPGRCGVPSKGMDREEAQKMAERLRDLEVAGWRVDHLLGNGKSAAVFAATRGGRSCALKIFDPAIVNRLGEADQLARLQRQVDLAAHPHSNLIPILDGGKCATTSYLYLAMERVTPTTLRDVVSTFPRSLIRSVIREVAGAAEHLERLKHVHRDIKPENVAIEMTLGRAILLDLGVVRPIGGPTLTDADGVDWFLGTLQYSSPEFLRRKEVDSIEGWRALTFYQLGGLLHDMIMRAPLFHQFSEPYGRLVYAIYHEIPTIIASDVPADLVALAQNCLQKDPNLRLESVSWRDFLRDDDRPRIAAEARDKLAARFHTPTSQATPASVNPHDSLRVSVQHLDAIIRQICIGSNIFPRVRIQTRDIEASSSQMAVSFPPSPSHRLVGTALFVFTLKVLDSVTSTVAIYANVAVSKQPIPKTVELPNQHKLFVGIFDASAVRTAVDLILTTGLAASIDVLDAAATSTTLPDLCWLDVPSLVQELEKMP